MIQKTGINGVQHLSMGTHQQSDQSEEKMRRETPQETVKNSSKKG